ncbi:hypothetical protein [Polaribacter sp. AHE13PA]|nr:hypothetical protein [Polaribacter sp. AHE13PA]QXP66410.1 hypothetical protein H0I28_14705 [Polaribacter sp. AHE13PA]
MFVGDFRFQDFKRLNTGSALAKTVIHNADDVEYILPPNDVIDIINV